MAITANTVNAQVPCKPDPYPIYWNVQGVGNASDLTEKYGILDASLTITGDMGGSWPTIRGSRVNNGGVPQAANWDEHEAALIASIPKRVPAGFTGQAVFDFESWTNVWDLNDGGGSWHSKVYQTYSLELVQKAHPSWSSAQVLEAAKVAFNESATQWLVRTLEVAKSVRPHAKWGFYGFPQNYVECVGSVCGYELPLIGDILRHYSDLQVPIYQASTGIYPSVYVFKENTVQQLPSYIRGTIQEAIRVAGNTSTPIYGFQMPQWHDLSGFLPADHWVEALQQPKLASNITDVNLIVWGYVPHKNATFRDYVTKTVGPTTLKFLQQLCK